jgi:hypothetical protein
MVRRQVKKMKINLYYFTISGFYMFGLSTSILLQLNNPSLWSLINFYSLFVMGYYITYINLLNLRKKDGKRQNGRKNIF